ncbi:MAG TPA: redox-sensitive transcriptional activator SoxR [Micromonosporaceae bacterium]|nr:redox-sensitive transcriptional activator SoxR [Micromonosporaceae bacterium]
MLTIGELSARSGVASSALRFYEQQGLISSTRTTGNQRRYDRAQLRRVSFIRIAQQVGISLDRIRQAMSELPDARTPTKADWEKLSRQWQSELDDRIGMLERLRDNLTGCIGCGCLSLQSCKLYNPEDELALEGTGARRLL